VPIESEIQIVWNLVHWFWAVTGPAEVELVASTMVIIPARVPAAMVKTPKKVFVPVFLLELISCGQRFKNRFTLESVIGKVRNILF